MVSENIGRIKRRKKIYNQTPIGKQKRQERERQRLKLDSNFHLMCNLRVHLYITLKRYLKTGKIKSACGYEIDHKAIIEHLKPFPKNIENYHVDHIIPLNLFDFDNPVHIKKAFAPTNHQWLTIEQNLKKNNRLVIPHYNHNF